MENKFVVFIDFETTGLDTSKDQPVEFASVIYDPLDKRYITSQEYLFKVNPSDEQKVMLESVCKINSDVLEMAIYNDDISLEDLLCFKLLRLGRISHFIAHNAPFDASFLKKVIDSSLYEKINWIDSMTDYPFNEKVRSRNLGHIAADYGFLNPFAHRALSDCLTLMELTKRMSWQEILDYAGQASYLVRSLEPFEKKDEVKKAGFYWNAEEKYWAKLMKEKEYAETTFKVKVLEKIEPWKLRGI